VAIPLSLQRRVESLVQDHLDRTILKSGKANDMLEENSMSEDLKEIQPDVNQGSLIDEHVMEKILHRKSFRMKNFQRSWQVLLYYSPCMLLLLLLKKWKELFGSLKFSKYVISCTIPALAGDLKLKKNTPPPKKKNKKTKTQPP
jgi:hypothetical protein